MSFQQKNMVDIVYRRGFTLWLYRTHEYLGEVKEEGYFDDSRTFIKAGDVILVSSEVEDAVSSTMLIVSKVTGSRVEVSNIN